MIAITPAKQTEVTKISCPQCKEKLRGIAIKKNSKVEGLTFKCKRCGNYWEVKSL